MSVAGFWQDSGSTQIQEIWPNLIPFLKICHHVIQFQRWWSSVDEETGKVVWTFESWSAEERQVSRPFQGKNISGPKKMTYLVQKIVGPKKFWSKKLFFQNKCWSKKILNPK